MVTFVRMECGSLIDSSEGDGGFETGNIHDMMSNQLADQSGAAQPKYRRFVGRPKVERVRGVIRGMDHEARSV